MSQQPNYLFPFVLDILSSKPLLSENENTLLREIEEKLGEGGVQPKNLKKELETIVDLGKSLGILSVQQDEIGIPFLLKSNKPIISASPSRYQMDSVEGDVTQMTGDITDADNFNSIPEPHWMDKTERPMRPNKDSTRYRSRSRPRQRSRASVSKKSKKIKEKVKRDKS